MNIFDIVNIQIAAVFVLFLVLIGGLAYTAHNSQQSPEYIQGYHDGYTQIDATKYNTACASVSTFSYPSYAFGYKVGYEDAIKNKKEQILNH